MMLFYKKWPVVCGKRVSENRSQGRLWGVGGQWLGEVWFSVAGSREGKAESPVSGGTAHEGEALGKDR